MSQTIILKKDGSRVMTPERFRPFVLFAAGLSILMNPGCRTWTGTEKKAAESYNRGNILRDAGFYDEAVEAYRRALELEPDMAAPAFNLALTFTELGRYPEALDILGPLRGRDPANLEIIRALGWTHLKSGNAEEALGFYNEALAVFEADEISLRAIAGIHQAADRESEAVEYRRTLVRLNPSLENQRYLARTLAAAGRDSESLDEYRVLVLGSAGDADLLSEAAEVAFENQLFLEAAGYYEGVVELEREDEEAWMMLARIRLTELQEYGGGLEALSTALERGFQDNDRLEALAGDSPPEIGPAVRDLINRRESP